MYEFNAFLEAYIFYLILCHIYILSVPFFFQDNFTALHLAVQANQPEVVEILLGHGANVQLKAGKVRYTNSDCDNETVNVFKKYCFFNTKRDFFDVHVLI